MTTILRPKFTVCIPAYNRARFLKPLLDSVMVQDYADFDILICEDLSRERGEIAEIAVKYSHRYPSKIFYHENETNLGYDANIRNLVERSRGEYCFFMGNDDLMCPGALKEVADLLVRNDNIGFVLRSYAWFDETPDKLSAEVRYFSEERTFAAGATAIGVCFRRSGVISGYIIHRGLARTAATNKFDGSLYYQMHLTASVLRTKSAVFTPKILVLCRNGEPPEFGNSPSEAGKYKPGVYTSEARLHMVGGALSIIRNLRDTGNIDLVEQVTRDYANYFYPYIRDQLDLPFAEFFRLYRSFARMGFSKYPLFHLYFFVGYILGQRRFDRVVGILRGMLGRSPNFGVS